MHTRIHANTHTNIHVAIPSRQHTSWFGWYTYVLAGCAPERRWYHRMDGRRARKVRGVTLRQQITTVCVKPRHTSTAFRHQSLVSGTAACRAPVQQVLPQIAVRCLRPTCVAESCGRSTWLITGEIYYVVAVYPPFSGVRYLGRSIVTRPNAV